MSQQNPWVYLLMVYRCAVTLFIHFVDCGFGSLDNRMQHVKSTQPYFQMCLELKILFLTTFKWANTG